MYSNLVYNSCPSILNNFENIQLHVIIMKIIKLQELGTF